MIRATQLVWLAMMAACGASVAAPEPAALKQREWVPVPFPPPPARPEMIPQQPHHASLWIDGEWRWRAARWSWFYGRWVEPPDLAAGFARWRIERTDDGTLHYAAGSWVSRTGRSLPAEQARALASARDGDVVEDIGIIEDVGRNRRAKPPADDSPDDAACDLGCRFDVGNPH